MTILARVVRPDFELTVCGTPSRPWFDWLLTAEVPLTESQVAWREIHRRNLAAAQGDTGAERAERPSPARRGQFDLVDTDEI